ncbi:AfsR/SARP family transcriptional regulator [Streptomyces clavuligerus]|uniref:AfsR/SARP family transcriptional regulator n=2 Tax=Streptomyces clavuligerus TaxID=1901 RepID=UPI00017FFCB1|nr:BTAD domain-containing putative transcriptional regulator [Streptomyces clavuligerus]EDY49676.1 AfsR-g [Streptomyces clavuligerus]MBY6307416.1 tetratricopeptide repeat protein [Streptomyces clavuligerus]WDN56730.1 tetratricopeptide repeat protein [Streptomyces clavuligerus]
MSGDSQGAVACREDGRAANAAGRGGGLRFGLLGAVRAWRGGDAVPLGTPQQRLVLAVLVLAEGRTVGRERLIRALWEESPPVTAVRTLQTYVSQLRRLFGAETVRWVGDGYAMPAHPTDLAEFRALCASGRRAEALDLWQGDALLGLTGRWAEAERARITGLVENTVEAHLEQRLHDGDAAGAGTELAALCAERPLHERLHGLLMRALYAQGRQARAIEVYTALRQRLDEELGVRPTAELASLYRRIISGQEPGARPAPVPENGGPHPGELPRQDGEEPEEGDEGDDAGGEGAAGTAAAPPAQLPADVHHFTGRDEIVRDLTAAATPGSTASAVALAGLGGVGKTALAVHVAHRVRHHYPDGQLFVDLRGAGSEPVPPGTALYAFLRALGAAASAVPEATPDRAAAFRSLLAGRRVLIVLDNARDFAQIRPLLPGAPGCAVIVTSRSWLGGFADGRTHALSAMDPRESLALFARIAGERRTRAERAEAAAIVELCGHLPLAVRIAASRLCSRPRWPLERLRHRLADERGRLAQLRLGDLSVESVFALSHDRLDRVDPARSRAFRLLSLLDGETFTLAAATAVLALPADETEEICEGLVDGSLLSSPEPGRYRYHDLMRDFARQRCAERESAGERDEALERLLDLWVATARGLDRFLYPGDSVPDGLAPTVHPLFRPQDVDTAVDRLLAESDGILRLLRRSLSGSSPSAPVDLVSVAEILTCLEYLTESGGDLVPYRTTVRLLVETAVARGERRAEGWARYLLGYAHYRRGELDAALGEFLLAWNASGESGDAVTLGRTLNRLGITARTAGRPEESVPYFQASLAIWYERGDRFPQGSTLGNLARSLLDLGRTEEAVAAARENVRIKEGLEGAGGEGTTATARYLLGLVLTGAGRPQEATGQLQAALEMFRARRLRLWQEATRLRLAQAQLALGRTDVARVLAGRCREAFRRWGEEPFAEQADAVLRSAEQGCSAVVATG